MSSVNVTLPANTSPVAAPLLLGYLWNWGLFGVLSVQVYLYYLAFPKDGSTPKTLVFGIYMIELAQTIIVTRDAYADYASGFGNLDALNSVQTIWLSVPIFSGIVSASVQMYYAYRVSVLSGSRIPLVIICTLALMQGSAGIAQGVQALKIDKFSELGVKAFVSCSVWLAGSAACDVIIASCMTYLLVRKKTKVRKTKVALTRLVRLTIETGIVTATTATIDLILFLVFPSAAYHGCVALLLAKMYSNSLLVLLNSRIRIVGGRGENEPDQSFNSLHLRSGSTAVRLPVSSRNIKESTGVHVEEQTWVHTDGGETIAMDEVGRTSTTKETQSLA